MINHCNFKTDVSDGTKGCMLSLRNHYEHFTCHGEENCIIYQIYRNTIYKNPLYHIQTTEIGSP